MPNCQGNLHITCTLFPPETQPNRVGRYGLIWPNRVGRCGLGGVKGHIKAFEKVKQGGTPCKIDAGGNSGAHTHCIYSKHSIMRY